MPKTGATSRRTFCRRTVGAFTLLGSPWRSPSEQTAPTLAPAQQDKLSAIATEFMRLYSVPGLSVAVAKQGDFVFQQGFGFANREKHEPVTPATLFRIASLSKPLTSTAIFTLIEGGKLALDAKVFGPGSVLGTTFGKPPYRAGVDQITIEHLLTHTGGGWDKNHDDPMFRNQDLNQRDLIAMTLRDRPLEFVPGTHYAYSNFGFCILGRVIETIANSHYADYVQATVLRPSGITRMALAGNTAGKRAPDEAHYYDQEGGDPYGMNVTRLDAAGGWLSTPSDMVRFLQQLNGFGAGPGILKPETVTVMTTGSAANPRYGKGWELNQHGTWWHIGDLPGTSAVLVRGSSGFNWAATMNTRRMNPDIRLKLDGTMREMADILKG